MKKLTNNAIKMTVLLSSMTCSTLSFALHAIVDTDTRDNCCPDTNTLVFSPMYNPIFDRPGRITANLNGITFSNYGGLQPHPVRALNSSSVFRTIESNFGFASSEQVVCFYSYPSISGGNVQLIMQGNNSANCEMFFVG